MKFYQKYKIQLSTFILILSLASCGEEASSNNAMSNNGTRTKVQLIIEISGTGLVLDQNAQINCAQNCTKELERDKKIELVANAGEGFVFQQWAGACSGRAKCILTMDTDKTVSAIFVPSENSGLTKLTVDKLGAGTITSAPGGIDCGALCQATYEENTEVSLTAVADAGFIFDKWTGDCSGPTCALSLSSDKIVTAVFSPEEGLFGLDVSITGSGSVSSTPAGIDCGNDCSAAFSEDSEISLSPSPAQGFGFTGWSGACSGTGSCTLTMDSNKIVGAEFTKDTGLSFTLNVSVSGSGSVVSTPAGIDCGNDCDESFSENTMVDLSPIPAAGNSFDRWEGACTGSANCIISMTENKNLVAVFKTAVVNSNIKIEDYIALGAAFTLPDIPNNASGITWNSNRQEYLVVRNGSAAIYRYDVNFNYLGVVRVMGINSDTEGLAYVGGNEVLIVSEDGFASKVVVDGSSTMINGTPPTSQRYSIIANGGNKGLEGIAVRKATANQLARVYACREGSNGSNMRVVWFDMPDPDPGVLLDYTSNLTVNEPWSASTAFAGQARDLAGMVYDDRTGHLIIVSERSAKAMQVDPATGAIVSQLALSGAPQFEGVTLGPNGELVFVSEGNWIRIYTKP